jgi:transcriptional regulator with XRE-family HTH domain
MQQTIGEKIKFLRTQKGLSQTALAKALYFSNRTISNWENNLRDVSVENLEKLAAYFKVPLQHFTNAIHSSISPQGAFQEVKFKKLVVNHSYFYLLLMLMIINTLMMWIPFQNRIQTLLLCLLFWLGFLIVSIMRYTKEYPQRTKTFLLPLETIITYQTELSEKSRRNFLFTMISLYVALILVSTFFYVSAYGMLNLVEVDLAFNTSFIIFYSWVIMLQGLILIKQIISGFPKQSMPYNRNQNGFGMRWHRMVASMQYGMVIFLIIYLNGFGHPFFPFALLLFTLVNGFSTVLLLRMILVTATKFFDSYKLMSQPISKNQREILQ